MKPISDEELAVRRQSMIDATPHLGRKSIARHWEDIPDRWTPELLHPAYIAGIIDGEGSVFTRGQGTPHIGFGNTNREVVRRFAVLGGSVQEYQDGERRALGRKTFWTWGAWGERAALVIRAIQPFMVIKGEAALGAVNEWDRVTFSGEMSHPRKRAFHITQCRDQLAAVGWPISGPSVYDIPCKNGHRMSPENLYYYRDGRASCKICRANYHLIARERRRG